MPRPSKPESAAALIDHLESRVLSGSLPAGSLIEPIRSYQQQFNISFSAAQRGIAELVERGILSKQGRRIVAGSTGREVKTGSPFRINAYLSPACVPDGAHSPGMSFTALIRIQQLALERNLALQSIPRRFDATNAAELDRAASECSGIIMIQEFDQEIRRFTPAVPMVGILMTDDFGGRISLVDLDPDNAVACAVRYFRKLGKREVEVATDSRPTYLKRADLFAAAWKRLTGNEVKIHIYDEKNDPPAIDFDPAKGYLFTTDTMLQHYSEDNLARHGAELAAQYDVLGIDGKRKLDPFFHRFPTVAADWAAIGQAAFEECLALMENPGRLRRRIGLPCHLIDADNNPIELEN